MKKRGFVLSLLMFFSMPALANTIGVVMVLRGEADLIKNNNASEKLKVGLNLSEGDTIATQADSFVKIVMTDRNILTIKENSKLKIQKYSIRDEAQKIKNQVQLNLEYGSLRSKVENKYDQNDELYEVHTPTAIAGVRGTDFLSEYDHKSEESIVCTLEGRVAYNSKVQNEHMKEPMMVNAGDFVKYKKGGGLKPPTKATQEWINKKFAGHDIHAKHDDKKQLQKNEPNNQREPLKKEAGPKEPIRRPKRN